MSRIRLLDLKLIRPKSSPSPGLGRLGQEPIAIVYSLSLLTVGVTLTVRAESRLYLDSSNFDI